MSAVLFGFLAALANAGQALISEELTPRAPRTMIAALVVVAGVALILLA